MPNLFRVSENEDISSSKFRVSGILSRASWVRTPARSLPRPPNCSGFLRKWTLCLSPYKFDSGVNGSNSWAHETQCYVDTMRPLGPPGRMLCNSSEGSGLGVCLLRLLNSQTLTFYWSHRRFISRSVWTDESLHSLIQRQHRFSKDCDINEVKGLWGETRH